MLQLALSAPARILHAPAPAPVAFSRPQGMRMLHAPKQAAVTQLETAFLDPVNVLGNIVELPSWQSLALLDQLNAYQKSFGKSFEHSEVKIAFNQMQKKVARFPDISLVDWKIDTHAFAEGASAAILANQSGTYFGQFPFPPHQADPHPELGYPTIFANSGLAWSFSLEV